MHTPVFVHMHLYTPHRPPLVPLVSDNATFIEAYIEEPLGIHDHAVSQVLILRPTIKFSLDRGWRFDSCARAMIHFCFLFFFSFSAFSSSFWDSPTLCRGVRRITAINEKIMLRERLRLLFFFFFPINYDAEKEILTLWAPSRLSPLLWKVHHLVFLPLSRGGRGGGDSTWTLSSRDRTSLAAGHLETASLLATETPVFFREHNVPLGKRARTVGGSSCFRLRI